MEEDQGLKETPDNQCVKASAEGNTNETTEGMAPQTSNVDSDRRPPGETEVRYSRLKLFKKVTQKSLEKCIDHASFNTFASMFRPLYKKNPQKMEKIHKQFIDELRKAVQEDISRLIEEGQLELKLNELDKLEKAARNKSDPAWRPSGIPEQDFSSFLIPYYEKQDAYMKRQLKKIRAENAVLAQKVQAGRKKIAETENCIAMAFDELKATLAEFERSASSFCPADVFDV
ncbi:polyamine-modulated factor 1 [Betta splendens]|uniref:Polyamine-modulated factor 1 n=1 Tax=Betta splendens TaxID=158456 RepID=A0A6P7NKR5_BETSP|nr:polyamine-modulated factor 1 [Betta splendens]